MIGKYRGQRVDNGEWVYGYYWASLDPCSEQTKWRGHYIHNGCNIENPIEVIPESVGQYWGHDHEDNPMYEGDIIEFHYFHGSIGAGGGFVEDEHELKGSLSLGELGWQIEAIEGEHWKGYTGYSDGEGESTIMDLAAMNESGIHEESFKATGKNIHQLKT